MIRSHLLNGTFAVLSLLLCLTSMNRQALADEKNPAVEPWQRQVYFGEQHMHTRNSFDAFTAGVTADLGRCLSFRHGRGDRALNYQTEDEAPDALRLRRDHRSLGVLSASSRTSLIRPARCRNRNSPRGSRRCETDPAAAGPAVQKLIQTLVQNNPMKEYVTPEQRVGNWQKFIATADKFYKPGKFTTLYAYEWTSIPNGANMHRNVFFREKPAAVPFSSFDSIYPEDLWTYLECSAIRASSASRSRTTPTFPTAGCSRPTSSSAAPWTRATPTPGGKRTAV